MAARNVGERLTGTYHNESRVKNQLACDETERSGRVFNDRIENLEAMTLGDINAHCISNTLFSPP